VVPIASPQFASSLLPWRQTPTIKSFRRHPACLTPETAANPVAAARPAATDCQMLIRTPHPVPAPSFHLQA
jgi:hypothetical protein